MEEFSVTPCTEGRSRMRTRNPSNWKRTREKVKRYSASGLPTYPACGHKGKPYQAYQCWCLTMLDIKRFHRNFYEIKRKDIQDSFILKHCEFNKPSRHKYEPTKKARALSVKYFVYSVSSDRRVPVCRSAFIGILGIGKNRILGILKRFQSTGLMPQENRGGDRVSGKMSQQRQKIKQFIESLKCDPPHYCRSKTHNRIYLDPSLNIKKLWRMYNSSVTHEFKVKECFFRHIFCTDYNIGFGTPATDVCSTCLRYRECIKRACDQENKIKFMTELRVHKLRSKCFFDLLREEKPTVKIISFDCQKNMPLPKIPDQSAYYSRQLYVYNFTMVEGSSHSKLTPENVFTYTWTELQRQKGSSEIASAVYHRLNNTVISPEIDTIRLVSDGCGGQNKNSNMIVMCCKWLGSEAPRNVTKIELIFPVTGHSFIPPDRVFGLVEKTVKKLTTIIKPEEYYEIFQRYGTVIPLAEIDVSDWKSARNETLKALPGWHFQISKCCRIVISRIFTRQGCKVMVRGEQFYKSDCGTDQSLVKKSKTLASIRPKKLQMNVPVKGAKLKDVNALLIKHFGEEWRQDPNLEFYKNALDWPTHEGDEDPLRDPICEEQEEIPDVRV